MRKKLQTIVSKSNVHEAGRVGKGVVTTGLAFAETALDGLPIPGAKAAVKGLLSVIEGIDKTSENAGTLRGLQDHLRLLVDSVLDPLSVKKESDLPRDLIESVENLTRDLRRFAVELKKASSKGSLRRYFSRDDDSADLQTMSQNINHTVERFQTSTLIRTGLDVTAVKENMSSMREDMARTNEESIRRERSRLIDNLPRAKQAGYLSGRSDAPTPCFEGTRTTVLDDAKQWIHAVTPDASRFYWVKGMAGMGKSTIAQTIAIYAAEAGCLGGSFFCSRREASLRDPSLIIPSLVYQFCQRDPEIRSHVGQALESLTDAAYETRQQQMEKLIIAPLSHVSPSHPPLLIVLDAFDECDAAGAKEVLQLLLSTASRIPFPLKFFITSRPEPHITSVLTQPAAIRTLVLHDIEKTVVRHDIELYLRAELKRIPERLGMTMSPDWITEEELIMLVDQAGILFVYAATVTRFVGDSKVRNPRKQLKILLRVRQVHGATPYAIVDKLYLQVLREMVSDENKQDVLERFQKVVGSIVLLRDPLPIDALERLTDVEPPDGQEALHLLHSIIIPPESADEAPRVYHPSFPEFITSPERCTDLDFFIHAGHHHARLALRCLAVMTSLLKRNPIGFSDPSVTNDKIQGLDERIRRGIPPELQYACRYWASHISNAEPIDETLAERLGNFTSRCLLAWVEVMSLLGNVPTAIACAKEAHERTLRTPILTPFLTILNDAHRFLLAHHSTIQTSAPHVYYSALPFTPKRTQIYQTYASGLDDSVTVLQGVAPEWSPCLMTLKADGWSPKCIAFSPDGSQLAFTSSGKVEVRDVTSGRHIVTLKTKEGEIRFIIFSRNGSLVGLGADQSFNMWDSDSWARQKLDGPTKWLPTLASSSDGVTPDTYSQDQPDQSRARTLLVDGMTMAKRLASADAIAISPDYSYLAVGVDQTIEIWNLVTGKQTLTLQGHTSIVQSTAFTSDGSRLASSDEDRTVRVWDTVSGIQTQKWESIEEKVTTVAFCPKSSRLAMGFKSGRIHVWDVDSSDVISLVGNSSEVLALAFSPDGLQLASGAQDWTVRLWTVPVNASSTTKAALAVRVVAFSRDGKHLATAAGNAVQLWIAELGELAWTLEGHSGQITDLAFPSDSSRLASGSNDHTIRIWDLEMGGLLLALEGHSRAVTSLAFSPDSSRLASGSSDATVRIWDPCLGEALITLDTADDMTLRSNDDSFSPSAEVVFSPDGSHLASASASRVILWDAVSGSQILALSLTSSKIAFSPDGSLIACRNSEGFRFWQIKSNSVTVPMRLGRWSKVHFDTPEFSPDASHVICRTIHGTDVVMDRTTNGKPRFTQSSCHTVTHSPSKRLSSFDDTVVVSHLPGWLVASRGCDEWVRICRIPPEYSVFNDAKMIACHGRKVAIGCIGGEVLLLDLSSFKF